MEKVRVTPSFQLGLGICVWKKWGASLFEEIFESSPLVICCSLRLGIHQMVCAFETNNSCFRTSTPRTNNAWPQRPSSVKLRVGGQGLKLYCRL
jgi:hypothetical protein